MPDARTRTVESISKAKAELDRALTELDGVRPLDPAVVGLVAHALRHYTTVTTPTVDMRSPANSFSGSAESCGAAASRARARRGRFRLGAPDA
jgi:hypothetical protein